MWLMKLSGTQVVWIIVTTEIVVIIGVNISPTITIAKQDAWLSMLMGGVIGLGLTWLHVKLSVLHPNQTLAQFSQELLGKWLGRLIILPYLITWFALPAGLLRSFADFIHLILLNRTPVWIILLLLICVITYLTSSSGITGIGRFCELVGPIIIVTLIVSFILKIQNIELHHLLPVYSDSGWVNIFKGSITPAYWFAGPFVLLVIISFMQSPKEALSKSILGVSITVFMVLSAILMVLLVFGPNLAAEFRYSYFAAVRTINILEFIQNIDIFIMFIFVFGVVAQSSLYFFIASYETANSFNLEEWRRMVWIGAPVVFILAMMVPDETAIISYDKFWSAIIYPVCGIGIPLFLLIISTVKKNSRENKV